MFESSGTDCRIADWGFYVPGRLEPLTAANDADAFDVLYSLRNSADKNMLIKTEYF